jgi:hypothetical protein
MKRAQTKTAAKGVQAQSSGRGEKIGRPLARTNNRKSPPMARLTLVSVRNDDGHVTGLEPCWTTLGEATNAVLRRLTAGGRA